MDCVDGPLSFVRLRAAQPERLEGGQAATPEGEA